MSTQEKIVPKRRSSRGSTAKGGAARRNLASVVEEHSSGQAPAEAVLKSSASRAVTVEPAKRKDRSAKEQAPKKSLLSTDRFDGIKRMTRDTYGEIKKVNWPDQETTRNLTVVVIAVSMALGILLGGIDFILLKIFEALP